MSNSSLSMEPSSGGGIMGREAWECVSLNMFMNFCREKTETGMKSQASTKRSK